ncbi:OmpA family protein [Yoonia sp. R2331]|uniref:OmpA family protein n=1 Tax=Yoonia sp. R2331 TaxID=3237238 RepID=UPI0034E5AC5D
MTKFSVRQSLDEAKAEGRTTEKILLGFVALVLCGALGLGAGIMLTRDGSTAPVQTAAVITDTAPATGQTTRRGVRWRPGAAEAEVAERPADLPVPVVPVAVASTAESEPAPEWQELVTRATDAMATAPIAPIPTTATATATVTEEIAAAADPATAVPLCVEQLGIVSSATTVPFEVGAVAPDPADLGLVRRMLQILATCDGIMLAVEGHSDATGSELQNIALSWQRAEATIAILAAEGFDTARVEPLGFGARKLLDTTGTPEGDALNRRVAFHIAPVEGSDLAAMFQ